MWRAAPTQQLWRTSKITVSVFSEWKAVLLGVNRPVWSLGHEIAAFVLKIIPCSAPRQRISTALTSPILYAVVFLPPPRKAERPDTSIRPSCPCFP